MSALVYVCLCEHVFVCVCVHVFVSVIFVLACVCVYMYLCVSVCISVCACVCVCMWAPVEVRRQPLGLLATRPVYSVGSQNQIRFGGNHLYPLSHLPDLICILSKLILRIQSENAVSN